MNHDDLTRLSELLGVHTSIGGYGAKIGKSGQYIFTGLNRQITHAERGQFRLECIKCEVSSV
jgi:hypothetical protein